jgi:hypothetical protein
MIGLNAYRWNRRILIQMQGQTQNWNIFVWELLSNHIQDLVSEMLYSHCFRTDEDTEWKKKRKEKKKWFLCNIQ